MKANILGICTTSDKFTDDVQTWDVVPMDMLDSNKGQKGDVVVCVHSDKTIIFFICPQCGSPARAGKHKTAFENGVVTLTPSLDMNCCSWHGYLKNNEFKS